ncbi:MAG: hypothetical protein GEU74_05105 [Nitriliruptorales bacterium]|nr:hypothetical protein [Nitriliruptorales bacterium]
MSATQPPIVTFLTDYGLDDPFVGLCHAAVLAVEPRTHIVDVCHSVPPQDVRAGAFLLAQCVPDLPPAVHVAVVDPGVGTARRGIAIRAGSHLFVGPDNGLMWPAAVRAGGIQGLWELADPAYHRQPVSRTFHGRDVFAPVAGHLAAGLPPARLGPALEPRDLARLELPGATVTEDEIDAEVVAVDRFGNLQLPVTGNDLARAGFTPGTRLDATVAGGAWTLTVTETFAAIPQGALGVLEDSFGYAAIFANAGNAAERLGAGPGAGVALRISGRLPH